MDAVLSVLARTGGGVAMKRVGLLSLILVLTNGCVVVGGYSSGRGWFMWPGSIVLIILFAIIFLLFRRRG